MAIAGRARTAPLWRWQCHPRPVRYSQHAVPVIKNTSTDRSLALIHATVQRCLSTPGSLQSGVAHGCFDRVLKCFLECAGALCGERKAQQMALFHSPLGVEEEKENEEDSVASEIYEIEVVVKSS